MRHALRVNGAERCDRDEPGDPSIEYHNERVEPCACGGMLTADQADPRSVYWAVVRHRRTLGHQAWLARVEAEG